MTALLTEVQTADEMVKIAREQVDAFSSGNWELLRGTLAYDSRYDELGTQRKIEVRRRSSSSSRPGSPRSRTAPAR